MTEVQIMLIVIAIGTVAIIMMAIAIIGLRPRLLELIEDLRSTLGGTQRALFHIEELVRELRDRGLAAQLSTVLAKAETALGGMDEMLDDATQTSQSVRARVDDLAAAQSELSGLAAALTDVISDVRDRELAGKLSNVLTDTSLLAADIGILTENANSYLEHGKPLVDNIGNVVDNARRRAGGISSSLGALKEGLRAGVETLREGGKQSADKR
jgi:ABC-type transporter Mla subunit MlaD